MPPDFLDSDHENEDRLRDPRESRNNPREALNDSSESREDSIGTSTNQAKRRRGASRLLNFTVPASSPEQIASNQPSTPSVRDRSGTPTDSGSTTSTSSLTSGTSGFVAADNPFASITSRLQAKNRLLQDQRDNENRVYDSLKIIGDMLVILANNIPPPRHVVANTSADTAPNFKSGSRLLNNIRDSVNEWYSNDANTSLFLTATNVQCIIRALPSVSAEQAKAYLSDFVTSVRQAATDWRESRRKMLLGLSTYAHFKQLTLDTLAKKFWGVDNPSESQKLRVCIYRNAVRTIEENEMDKKSLIAQLEDAWDELQEEDEGERMAKCSRALQIDAALYQDAI